jgi:hypothetical protein
MNKKQTINYLSISLILSFILIVHCKADDDVNRAKQTLESIYNHYSVKGSFLLRETFPFNDSHQVTYLDNAEQAKKKNEFSYLWPFSGSLSAVSALYEVKGDKGYLEMFDNTVLPGLELYWDTVRNPGAYASYIKIKPLPDRFYDDNVWIGIDFTDMYLSSKNESNLQKAEAVG